MARPRHDEGRGIGAIIAEVVTIAPPTDAIRPETDAISSNRRNNI
ncbi:hypothetical protein [Alkalihalophilus marmarensis]|nr:hypothetical protein [Alkalihalophilus marmarensis]